MKIVKIIACLSFFLATNICIAQTLEFTPIFFSFSSPVDIANAGDDSDRLFIVERSGQIQIIDANGTTLSTPFLNINSKVLSGGERGLLGLAFHPDYANNGYFFVNYTNNSGNTVIARYSVSAGNANLADVSSEVILLTINQPFGNHNGGCLKFGPDGYLYIGTGDGGSGGDPDCYAQNNLDLLGKMLRIDVNQNATYGIPASNPFVGNAAYLPEIWATGLRNPWRFSFDCATGDLWIADVGQNAWEELNFQPANSAGGENYGWDVMEGNHCFGGGVDPDCPAGTAVCFSPNYTAPIWETDQNDFTGGYSITGGFVYRGCRYPDLVGKYICTDYATNNTWLIDGAGNATFFNGLGNSNVSTFGEDENGELYAASLGGTIYQVRDTNNEIDCSCPATLHLTNAICSGTYSSSASITSDGQVLAGNNVVFQSNEIELQPPFCVELNTEFLAEIVSCSPFTVNFAQKRQVNNEINSIFKDNLPSTLFVSNFSSENKAFIEFELPTIGKIELNIVDLNQKLIARLIEQEYRPKGLHSWVVKTDHLSKGVYTVELIVNKDYKLNKKFIIE